MAEPTEAAALLEAGAMYARRIGLRGPGGATVLAGFKPGGFSLYFDDAPIFHYDLDGRWQRAFLGRTHYLKGLDAAVRAVERAREGENLVLRRRTLRFDEASDVDDAARAAALDLIGEVESGRLARVVPTRSGRPADPDELRAMLDRIGRWDAAAWFAHRERYLGAYGPAPFLPPDCPGPVVLQATLGQGPGHAFGLGGEAPYVRSAEEFNAHAREVAALLGRRLEQCRSIFLAGADALRRPVDDSAAYFEAAGRVFAIGPPASRPRAGDAAPHRLDGIHAWIDGGDAAGQRPDVAGWRRLAALHLRRVHVGVDLARAPAGAAWGVGLPGLISELKAAGLAVSLSALAGEDGDARHAASVAEAFRALPPLSPGDLISVVDASDLADASAFGREGRLAGWREELAGAVEGRGVKVVAYNPDKQWR